MWHVEVILISFFSLNYNAGMHAWFAAAADTRYAVVAPIIGVQVLSNYIFCKYSTYCIN